MEHRSARHFGLIDAMILLAATATGLAWGRHHLITAFSATEVPIMAGIPGMNFNRPMQFTDRVNAFTHGTQRSLACRSVALLALRLRNPRPSRIQMADQPGTLAVATATAYTLGIACSFLLAFAIRAKYKPSWSDYSGQMIDCRGTALAISAAWAILAVSGRWHPESSWIDRLGLLIGAAWIALSTAGNSFDWW